MDPNEITGGRTTFRDLTNITSQETPVVDANERRRQMARAKRASMSAEEKNKMNKKRREAYHLKKSQGMMDACSKGNDHELYCENHQPDADDDWLHTNLSDHPQIIADEDISNELSEIGNQIGSDSTQKVIDTNENAIARTPFGDLTNIAIQDTMVVDASERRRQMDRAKRSSMSVEEKNEINKKRREAYHLKKAQGTQDLCSNEIANQIGSNSTPQFSDSKERKSSRERSQYASMSVEQRRLLYTTPARKESKQSYKKRQKDMLANTLNLESIAMENPKFIPELVWPTVDASGSNGSPVSACDWVIPELSPTPFMPASTQTDDMSATRLKHKRHVPSGERQSLLSRQNKKFQATIGRNLAAPPDDILGVATKGDNETARNGG